ncbi:molybdate transport system regulatory protein [Dyella jiangningensis]|uniref:TOBE domain-containing protein n=1 Tax=Dyella sp. AtDHG13 TaxID=1938897 RepID=UPI0008801909|nr:TOBE domain-containing protein [Dyella sp. AtDHG13]PXV60328.1 molybdate transport system regulatory protein [Dyella sp. AtDHG13]SDJ40959.1 molybdate transport system regulatory protein [Dyella jiangningensis]
MLIIKGSLGLESDGRHFGGHDRIALLAKIGELGSIAAAAREVGLSYKGAWDAVDAMNNLAGEPLVLRAVGGRSGGGAELTERGRRLVDVFGHMEALHRRFMEQLTAFADDPLSDIDLVRRFLMKTSARNQLAGVVASVEAGAVNDVIQLDIQGGQRLVATVTRESTKSLGLAPGKKAFALIKASSVIVAVPDGGLRLSARNQLAGVVSYVRRGEVNGEVGIELKGGNVLVAVITLGSVDALDLREGFDVVAIVKASSIILGTLE